MNMNVQKTILAATTLALVAACGGGGGGGAGGPVASTNTFNVQSGYQRLASAGWNKTFNVTGSCTGTLTVTAAPATTATTFEGSSALSGNEVSSFSWAGCTPASGSTTIVRYFDSNHLPLGYSESGGYGVYVSTPNIPSAAKVNDVVIVGTINKYTSSAKTTPNGREDVTLVMEADTATTAIANMIYKTYDSSGTLTLTEQDRFRVAADGSLVPISLDVQFSTGERIFGH